MAILFVGWGVFFIYCLVRFRAGADRVARYDDIKARPSKYAEVLVVAIEAVLLVGVSMPVWASYRNEPPTDNPLTVRLVAQQFAWNIHYPGPDGKFGRTEARLVNETTNPIGLDRDNDPAAADDIVTINNFYVPKDRDVVVRLSSKDVIHSFAVPLLRVKQDVNPGMEVPVWFKAVKTNDEVREQLIKRVKVPTSEDGIAAFAFKYRNDIFMEDIGRGAEGRPLVARGGWVTKELIAALAQAGVTEVAVAPKDPVNIQCAQLCGLGHYRMLGQMQILEPAAFDEWLESQAGGEEEFFDDDE
jgi:cytochrome c oxidase subunit 2